MTTECVVLLVIYRVLEVVSPVLPTIEACDAAHPLVIETFLTASVSPFSLAISGAMLSPESDETGSPSKITPTVSLVRAFSCWVDALASATDKRPPSSESWLQFQF
jgi:hypothetical protein